jgi:sialic acid synthase SpsE
VTPPPAVEFIADVGAAHGGNLEQAKLLIAAAKSAGADSVKFQIGLSKLATPGTPQAESFEQLDFSFSDLDILRKEAANLGIKFSASAWSLEAIDWLCDGGVPYLKIGSGDLTHEPILNRAGESEIPIYLSTGMGTEDEIRSAVALAGGVVDALLACTVSYPGAIEDSNLARLNSLRGLKADGLCHRVGFSSHCEDWRVPAFAAQLGAEVVEAHLALDDSYIAAHLPELWFKHMTQWVRAGALDALPSHLQETALGSGTLGVLPCEQKWRGVARRDPTTGLRP